MAWDAQTLVLGAAVFVAAHMLLAIFSKWVHPLVMLAAAFVVLSPLSAATTLPGVMLFKWARLYVTILALLITLIVIKPRQLGSGAKALLVLSIFYVAGALWSGDAVGGLAFKGMYLLTILMGLAAVLVAADLTAIYRSLRALMVAWGILVAVFLLSLAVGRGELHFGRLSVLGLNANRVAEALSPAVILCCYGIFYDPAKKWRTLAYFIGVPAVALVLATGSRAGFGMAALGSMVLLLPLVRRPGLLITGMVLFGVAAMVITGLVEDTAASRVTEVNLNTRWDFWVAAWHMYLEHPIIGSGWAYMATGSGYGSSVNLLNIYLQILVEIGAIGGILAAICLAYMTWAGVRGYRVSMYFQQLRPTTYLAWAILLSILAQGLFESGTLMGSSINAMLLAMSVGIFDWSFAAARTTVATQQHMAAFDSPAFPWAGSSGLANPS